jgi:hypothetical protein
MKTLRISDDVHRKLTATVGTLMAQTGKMQTYQDAIEAMLTRSVILPPELLAEIENLIQAKKYLGFATVVEFIRDATRWRLKFLKEDFKYVKIPREKYQRLNEALKGMNREETVSDIMLLTRQHNCPSINPLREQIKAAVLKNRYDWQIARINEKGKIVLEQS